MIKVGIVKTVNEEKCTGRVLFPDTGQLSAELQIGYRGTCKSKDYWIPEIEEQVICGFTEQKVGYILASVYSDEDVPPVSNKRKRHMTFVDGTVIEYDTSTSTLTIDATGPINIKGNINVQGDVIADGISLKNHTHREQIL
ncbi:phage baseplate assembly protein V [Clostridium sp. CX1]|uniref:phage baseplate assembly protein V n=1 Tax=Clostridium sp. CX1 TaxID=2978346 RepID=UPI0021BF198A|nr:phage baseplate assembly protein V [Clostridium sp. CX1]MCT8975489.1 phage baseplate assembly protein V [Clostridium sp. CX1]